MKTNKISLLAMLALGGLVTFGTLAKAEDTNTAAKPPGDHQGPPGGPRGGMQDRGAKLAEELGLSDDQKTKFQEVMKEQGDKRKALREDTSLSDDDKKTKGKALRDETDAKIKAILTAEQYEKWQKLQQGRRGPGGPGGPGGKPPGDKPAGAPEKKD
jgi:periplasmic protein CpxP/Spy